MPTAESIDLKEAFAAEDLSTAALTELRRTVHTSIERRSEVERQLENFGDIAKKLSSENKAETRRATMLWVLGLVEEAVPILEKARASKDKAFLLGVSYLDLGRYTDAVAQLKEAYDGDSSDPLVLAALAEAQVYAGLHDPAETTLERLAKKAPESGDVWYVRGLSEDLRGFRAKAIELYEKALEQEPNHAKALFRLAYTYDLMGEDARSRELYDQLRKLRPLHVNTMLNLGVIYEDEGLYDKAAECYRSVLDYFPTHARARLYFKDAQASMNMFYDEEAAKREAKVKQILAQPLSELSFSQRVRNGLAHLGALSIGELAQKTEEELLEIPNFGKTSLREVKEFLASKGLSLSSGSKEPLPVPGGAPPADVESKAVGDFDWSGRIKKAFEKLEIKTIGDLLKRTETELMSMKNLGATSINEIRRKLGALGVSMKAE